MLQTYPIKINDTAIPNPDSYDESSEVVESVNQSEAGTDIVLLTRRDKLSASLSFKASSHLAKTLATYRDTEPLSVQIYDNKSAAYKTRSMRIRNYRSSLVEDSWKTVNTNGLYQISFDLVEY